MDALTTDNYLDILFGGGLDPAETDAGLAAMRKAENERLAEIAEEKAYRAAHRCPKCSGEGRIAYYAHIKGGECFACGGTGIKH